MSGFLDDYDDEDYNDDIVNDCTHDIITDNMCKLCGIPFLTNEYFVNDDITMGEGTNTIKKSYGNEYLLNQARELPFERDTLTTFIAALERENIYIKNTYEITPKILAIYIIKYCLLPGIIETSSETIFKLCNPEMKPKDKKKIIKYLESGVFLDTTIIYIDPMNYVKEFLYFKRKDILHTPFSEIDDLQIPNRYEVHPDDIDVINVAKYLLIRKTIVTKYSKERAEIILEEINEYYNEVLIYGDGHSDKYDHLSEHLNNYSWCFETVSRISAFLLYNILFLSLPDAMENAVKGKMVVGENEYYPDRYYSAEDITQYYGITLNSLQTLINTNGIRALSSRKGKRKTKE